MPCGHLAYILNQQPGKPTSQEPYGFFKQTHIQNLYLLQGGAHNRQVCIKYLTSYINMSYF